MHTPVVRHHVRLHCLKVLQTLWRALCHKVCDSGRSRSRREKGERCALFARVFWAITAVEQRAGGYEPCRGRLRRRPLWLLWPLRPLRPLGSWQLCQLLLGTALNIDGDTALNIGGDTALNIGGESPLGTLR